MSLLATFALLVLFSLLHDDSGCDCSCSCDEEEPFYTDQERGEGMHLPDRDSFGKRAPAAAPMPSRRTRYLAIALAIVVVGALAVWAINSQPTTTHASILPADPASRAPVTIETTAPETRDVAPTANASDVEPNPEPLTMPAPLTSEPSLLPAEAVVNATDVLPVVPTLAPTALDVAFFEVGSSRDEVIAAQGRPPTYSAHHDRTLWWGSSRVEFDEQGKVRSWASGTPPLNTLGR